MRITKQSGGKWMVVFCGVSALGDVIPFVKYFTETWLMGNITLLDSLLFLFLVGYYGLALCFICKGVYSLIQGMRPVNRFMQLHSEIEREWQNTKNDNEIYCFGTERLLGEIYQDRERLSLKLRKFRISPPDPMDPKNWMHFIRDLSPLSEEGMLDEARRRYGDPRATPMTFRLVTLLRRYVHACLDNFFRFRQ